MKVLGANGLQYLITKLMGVDFIVEEGINGAWTYRKWNSGVSECWSDFAFSATTQTTVNMAGNLPSGIMDTTTQKYIFASGSFSGIVDSHIGYTRCSNGGYYDVYLLRSSSSSAAGSVKIEIKGRWK